MGSFCWPVGASPLYAAVGRRFCLPPSLSGFRSCFSRSDWSAAVFRPLRWPFSLAAFVRRCRRPLSLATSLSRSCRPADPDSATEFHFHTYLRRRLAGQHVRRRTQRTRNLHSSPKSARPVKPARTLGRRSRKINADDNRTGRRRAFARRASRRPAPVPPKSRCRRSSCVRLAFRRRATGSAHNPGSRRARPHGRG